MNITTKTYEIPVTLKGAPNTAEELDKLMGRVGATFDLAIEKLVAHVVLAKLRDKLADAMEAAGFPRDTKTEGDKTITVKPDKRWYAKGFAALNWDAAKRQQVTQALADELGFDVSATRSGGSGAPSKEDEKNATALIAAIESGQSTYETVKSKLEAQNPGLDIPVEDDGSISHANLSNAIGVQRRRLTAEIKAAQQSSLGL